MNLTLRPELTIGFSKASMLSPDGRCKSFDARANGYVRGEGAGVRHSQAARARIGRWRSHLRCHPRDGGQPGWPHRGHLSSRTRPRKRRTSSTPCGSPRSRRRVCSMSRRTGPELPVGDPIEAAALGAVYGKARKPEDRCVIGSIKSNVGTSGSGRGNRRLDQGGAVSAAPPDSQDPALRESEPANRLRRSAIEGRAASWSPGPKRTASRRARA